MEVEEVDSPLPKIQSASLDIFDIEGSQDVCRLGNEKQNWAKELVESDNLRNLVETFKVDMIVDMM